MSQRIGTVLVFKEGVSPEEAASALQQIADVLDLPSEVTVYEYADGRNTDNSTRGGRVTGSHKRPYNYQDSLHEFDDEFGGPTWYVP